MKNGNSEHDLDSVARLVRRHNAMLDVLLQHVACIEAKLAVITAKTLRDGSLGWAKQMKDCTEPLALAEMIGEIQDKLCTHKSR
jgi:hypothetical protein